MFLPALLKRMMFLLIVGGSRSPALMSCNYDGELIIYSSAYTYIVGDSVVQLFHSKYLQKYDSMRASVSDTLTVFTMSPYIDTIIAIRDDLTR